jgi:hypothetical protein
MQKNNQTTSITLEALITFQAEIGHNETFCQERQFFHFVTNQSMKLRSDVVFNGFADSYIP